MSLAPVGLLRDIASSPVLERLSTMASSPTKSRAAAPSATQPDPFALHLDQIRSSFSPSVLTRAQSLVSAVE
ncbi:MAG TPA: hypothetical protein VK149_00020, partial [Sideroxyarcus sp.]|nr:hypothetical protein [Sideroxyarcus sp.]